jgi:AcrR family transcriptional regulator
MTTIDERPVIEKRSRAKQPGRLTKAKILAAAEEVLLRHGAAKATVVDVARMLGVSHANVYKFFASKAALRHAVVEAWLDRMDAPLAAIVQQHASPQVRLVNWLDAFVDARQRSWRNDPNLFRAFQVVAAEQPPAVWMAYKDRLTRSLAGIIAEGVADGSFKLADPLAAAVAVIDGNARFFHPAHHREWADPRAQASYATLQGLLLAGMRAGPS